MGQAVEPFVVVAAQVGGPADSGGVGRQLVVDQENVILAAAGQGGIERVEGGEIVGEGEPGDGQPVLVEGQVTAVIRAAAANVGEKFDVAVQIDPGDKAIHRAAQSRVRRAGRRQTGRTHVPHQVELVVGGEQHLVDKADRQHDVPIQSGRLGVENGDVGEGVEQQRPVVVVYGQAAHGR